jgi:hypothetical protein
MANEHQRTEDTGVGLSRRQVLARGAVAAGIVWAAPVIRTASAYATSAAGTERPCSKFYLVCIDQLGARPVRFINDSKGYDEMPSDAIISRFRPIPGPAPAPTTTTTSSTSTTTTSSTSSTTTSSTSSTTTSSTSTTTTTKPFRDPTQGLGLFPGDEATPDPRTLRNKTKRKTKKPTTTTTTDPNADPGAAASPLDPSSPTFDDLGLFPDPTATPPAVDATGIPAFDTLPPGIEQWLTDNPDVPVRYPDVPPMLTQTNDDAWAVLLPAVESGPNPDTHQCRAVKGWSHAGTKYAEFYVDANLAGTDEENLRLIFPSPTMDDGNPGAIENLFLVYCCP